MTKKMESLVIKVAQLKKSILEKIKMNYRKFHRDLIIKNVYHNSSDSIVRIISYNDQINGTTT